MTCLQIAMAQSKDDPPKARKGETKKMVRTEPKPKRANLDPVDSCQVSEACAIMLKSNRLSVLVLQLCCW